MADVAVFMGSISDEVRVIPCLEVLRSLGISFFVTITSAHRTPDRTERLIRTAEAEGCKVFICAAGMAAHLAGAVCARTIKPVIGIPLSSATLSGMDALYSTVQMPSGFPVATVALDSTGARNAAWLAASILALHDEKLAQKLQEVRTDGQNDIERKAQALEVKYATIQKS